MIFTEMCEDLLKGYHKYAVRRNYPELITCVSAVDGQHGEKMLMYCEFDQPKFPFVITDEIFDSDDWIVYDEIEDRLNISNFMTMPSVKDFLRIMRDNSNSEYVPNEFRDDNTLQLRLKEAIALKVVSAFGNTMVVTDIGYDLIKTL